MFSKQKQNRSDLLEKGTFSRKRHERNFRGAYSAPYFDLGGGNRRIDKLKVTKLYSTLVHFTCFMYSRLQFKRDKGNKNIYIHFTAEVSRVLGQ